MLKDNHLISSSFNFPFTTKTLTTTRDELLSLSLFIQNNSNYQQNITAHTHVSSALRVLVGLCINNTLTIRSKVKKRALRFSMRCERDT